MARYNILKNENSYQQYNIYSMYISYKNIMITFSVLDIYYTKVATSQKWENSIRRERIRWKVYMQMSTNPVVMC